MIMVIFRNMMMNAMRNNYGSTSECSNIDKEPNTNTIRVFELFKDSCYMWILRLANL
jgi:hypothetical protein